MDGSSGDRVTAFRVAFFPGGLEVVFLPGFPVVTVFVAFMESFFLAMATGPGEAGRMPNLGGDAAIRTVPPLKIHDCLN